MRNLITTILAILISLSLLIAGVYEIVYGETAFSLVDQVPYLDHTTFWRPSGFAIVVGGILTSVFTMYPPRYVFGGIGTVFRYFSQSTIDAHTLKQDIEQIVEWNSRIQDNKLQALKQIQSNNNGDLPGYLFSLVSTNYSTDAIENFGKTNIEEHYQREMVNVEVLQTLGSASPAFGMFGTLCGLMMVMTQMENPSQMGTGMATALTTTLYGIVLAHLVFYPSARKLRNIAQIRRFRELMILDGVLMINEGRSNFYIRDKLTSYLARSYSFNQDMQTAPDIDTSSSGSEKAA